MDLRKRESLLEIEGRKRERLLFSECFSLRWVYTEKGSVLPGRNDTIAELTHRDGKYIGQGMELNNKYKRVTA